jgi:RNA polymerase sigma-54 factor
LQESSFDNNDNFSLDEYQQDDDIPDYKLNIQTQKDEARNNYTYAASTTLFDFLKEQLQMKSVSGTIKKLAEYVIGNIDQDGYLRRDVESMVDDFSFQSGEIVEDDKMKAALKLIQSFDPSGVGASSLQECLLIQLKRKNATPEILDARRIVEICFDEFSRKHYDKIERKLELSKEAIRLAIEEIVKLNPKPGSEWESDFTMNSMQIIPDFILENQDGELVLSLTNRFDQQLRVNKEFSDMVEQYTGDKKNQSRDLKNAVFFAKQKLDSARWFINAVKQREETLERTMSAIIEWQKEFFLDGDETKLRPLVLRTIADLTGYDVSTISRVSNSKYIQTEFGVYPVKYFFLEKMQTQEGETIASNEVKIILDECIKSEDKQNPLTDDRLTEILKSKGYSIARRTVAKYREQLNYPAARLRKEFI